MANSNTNMINLGFMVLVGLLIYRLYMDNQGVEKFSRSDPTTLAELSKPRSKMVSSGVKAATSMDIEDESKAFIAMQLSKKAITNSKELLPKTSGFITDNEECQFVLQPDAEQASQAGVAIQAQLISQ